MTTLDDNRCGSCGHDLRGDEHFCDMCGAPCIDGETSRIPDLIGLAEVLDADDELAPAIAALPPRTALLVVRHGPNAPSRYFIEDRLTTIGRNSDADIFLDDPTVSRRHAALHHTDDGYVMEDLGSLNGTYVDGQRVEAVALQNLNEIRVGAFSLLIILADSDAQRVVHDSSRSYDSFRAQPVV